MAVYKPTYCYPFLNALDIRLGVSKNHTTPCEYLKCKIDTSNINVTGYHIRLLDYNNNQIFPVANNGEGYITPVAELQMSNNGDVPYEEYGSNSGLNGTYLEIPFFQNYINPIYYQPTSGAKYSSHNAIYYKGHYTVDYVIGMEERHSDDPAADVTNWQYNTTASRLEYIPSLSATDPITSFALNGDTVVMGQYTLFIGSGTLSNYSGIYSIQKEKNSVDNIVIYLELVYSLAIPNGKWFLITSTKPTQPVDGTYWNDLTASSGGVYGVLKQYSASTGTWVNYNGTYAYTTTNQFTPGTDWTPTNGNLWKNNDTANERYQYKRYQTTSELITIVKGYCHNSIFEAVVSGTTITITQQSNLVMWTDSDGNDLPGIDIDLARVKWEITLYQGNYTSSDGHSDRSILYNSVDEYYYDMILNSSTILGTTPSRIQIASSNDTDATIPSGGSNSLVLQGKYLQLYNYDSSNNKETDLSSRLYVSSYDATYGHVYPLTGTLDGGVINQLTENNGVGLCRFYKHSNDPTAILDGEMVDYVVNKNIKLGGFNTDSVTTNKIVPLNKTDETKGDPTLSSYDLGFTVASDDRVLLMKQDDASQNGIYIVNTSGDGEEVADCTGWTRAASYNTWGNYIGAVIYDAHSKVNYESLAGVGGTLWNPKSSTSGDSPLYFGDERPIVLFESKLDYSAAVYSNTSTVPTSTTIDGITVKVNDLVLLNTHAIYKITAITGTTISESELYQTMIEGQYCQITSGEIYGKQIFKYANSTLATTLELSTASVLQNSTTKTYIGPYIGLNKGMKLKFNSDVIQFSGQEDTTSWLKINDVNTNLWYITHDTLKSPLLSFSSSDEDVPYTYELRSFYKTSDENPFYLYEMPYLTIEVNGGNADVMTASSYGNFYDADNQQFNVEALASSQTYYPFAVQVYLSDASIAGHSVKLAGHYKQFEQNSWESYRWILLNSSGTILQDTGKKYDKAMDVIFYGLSNDSDTVYNIYYAVLFVEDNLGNNLETVVKLVVAPYVSTSRAYVPFTACFDRATHSVKLLYQDYSIMMPSILDESNVYQAFISGNTDSGFDNSVSYKTDEIRSDYGGYMNIGYANNQTNVPVYLGDSYIQYYKNYIGIPINSGLIYQNVFTYSSNTGDSDSIIKLSESEKGEIYYQTEVILDDNYCGQILDLAIQRDDSTYSNKYLHCNIFVPDNFTDALANTLNSNRQYIGVQLKYDNSVMDAVYFTNNPILDISNTTKRYYLQPSANLSTNNTEFLHFNLDTDNNHTLYIAQSDIITAGTLDTITYLNSSKFFGNLNLICEDDVPDDYLTTSGNKNTSSCSTNAPSYWVENIAGISDGRGSITLQEDAGSYLYNSPVLNYEDTSITEVKWPSNDGSYYWNETASSNDMDQYAASWSNFISYYNDSVVKSENLIPLYAYKRHNGELSDQKLKFIIAINSVEDLCAGLSNSSITLTLNNNSIIITTGTTQLGYITLNKTNYS